MRRAILWTAQRRRVLGLAALGTYLLVVFLYVFVLVVASDTHPIGHLNTGDSNNLVSGAHVALDCLRNSTFTECGPAVGPYPLLQYVPAVTLIQFGFSDDHILGALATLSFVALIALLIAAVFVFRERPKVAVLTVLMLVPSSLLYQSTSAFGEGLTACLVGGAVLAAARRRPWLVFALVSVAALGKETLAPFVVVLVLICARSSRDGWLPARKLTLAAVGGGALGTVVSLLFNVFRFGTIRNTSYLVDAYRTPGVGRKLEFFAGIIASPSAGVMWFWPFLALVTVVGGAIGVHRLTRSRRDVRGALPVLGVAGVMLAWFAALSFWFSPFGWEAYGPRLEVPVLVGCAVAIAHIAGDSIVRIIEQRTIGLIAAAIALGFGCLQLAAPWRWSDAMTQLFRTPTGACLESPVPVHPSVDADLYYRCVSEMLWRRTPVVFDELLVSPLTSVAGLAAVAGAVGVALLLWDLRSPKLAQ